MKKIFVITLFVSLLSAMSGFAQDKSRAVYGELFGASGVGVMMPGLFRAKGMALVIGRALGLDLRFHRPDFRSSLRMTRCLLITARCLSASRLR